MELVHTRVELSVPTALLRIRAGSGHVAAYRPSSRDRLAGHDVDMCEDLLGQTESRLTENQECGGQ